MKFSYKSQGEQTQSYEPLPAGDYGAVLTSVTPKKSKNGNDMAELEFQVDGTSRKITERIPLMESLAWKWDQLAAAFGVFHGEGDQADIDTDDFVGNSLKFNLKIETYTNKDGDEKQTNRIGYFIAKEDPKPFNKAAPKAASHAAPKKEIDNSANEKADDEESNDDVPF